MNSITYLTSHQLRRAASLMEKIQSHKKEINKIMGLPIEPASIPATKRKFKMSAAAKARISAAAKARWAKAKAAGKKKL